MQAEKKQLEILNTWEVVPRPSNTTLLLPELAVFSALCLQLRLVPFIVLLNEVQFLLQVLLT
jgi:hypothetical protein